MNPPPPLDPPWSLEHVALAAADLGAFCWEIKTDRVLWSERAHAIFGLSPEEFDGTSAAFLARVHPADRESLWAEISRAIEHGPDEWKCEHRVLGGDAERWVACRGRVLRDESGKAIRMAGVVQEITERRRAEFAQREQAALMHAALEASVFAVVVLDTTGRIVFSNELAASLLGLTPSVVEGRTYDAPQWKHTDVDGGPWPDEKQPFVRVMTTGKPVYGVQHAIERPDGRRTILRINGAPIYDERGAIRLVAFSFEDVTHRLAMEESLRQKQKMEAIGTLAGGVAHDFNNLLTAILSFVSFARLKLRSGRVPSDELDGISEASRRAASLTRKLLAFGRSDIARPVVFDVRSRVEEEVRLLERMIGSHVALKLELADEPCWVRLDEAHLQQILLNLTINARDAMPDGGEIRIAIARLSVPDPDDAAASRAYVRLTIRDSGEGMDEETRRRSIEPFFTTKPRNEGTGLGLSTCHSIVAQAGGSLSIESSPGAGTTVTVLLPLASLEGTTSPSHRPPTSGGGTGARVLVVEDDPILRKIVVRSLERAHLHVVAAESAEEALRLPRAELDSIDLVVTDVVLPGKSGPELVESLRVSRPELMALFVSGYAPELPADGPDPFLPKPYTPELLISKVRDILGESAAPGAGPSLRANE